MNSLPAPFLLASLIYRNLVILAAALLASSIAPAQDKSATDGEKGALTVKDQHSEIGIPSVKELQHRLTRSIPTHSGSPKLDSASFFTGAFLL